MVNSVAGGPSMVGPLARQRAAMFSAITETQGFIVLDEKSEEIRGRRRVRSSSIDSRITSSGRAD